MSTRVLVLTAPTGDGQVSGARALTESLQEHERLQAAELETEPSLMGLRVWRFVNRGFPDAEWPPRVVRLALALLAARRLRRAVALSGVDVVVTDHPLLSATLGELRLHGRLQVPVCSWIPDPAGLDYLAHPGIDMHLLSWPELRPEIEAIAGPGKATVVRPPIDRRYLNPLDRAGGRAWLRLPQQRPVVVVSGGARGIGDLAGAVAIACEAVEDVMVIAVAGRGDRAREALSARFAADPRVRVLGFSEQMPALLAAADALIHTTGGATALEARVVGCPLINYGTDLARVRAQAQAMERLGLALWAPDSSSLAPALRRVLADGRRPPLDLAALPRAADVIVRVADG